MRFFSKKKEGLMESKATGQEFKPKEPRDLSLVLDRMGVGFLVLDSKDCISEVNQSCMNFLEIPSSALGNPVVEILKAHELVELFRKVKKERSVVKEIDGPTSVSYTHLTLPTSDLV